MDAHSVCIASFDIISQPVSHEAPVWLPAQRASVSHTFRLGVYLTTASSPLSDHGTEIVTYMDGSCS